MLRLYYLILFLFINFSYNLYVVTLGALLIFWWKVLSQVTPPSHYPEEWVGKELAIWCGKTSEQQIFPLSSSYFKHFFFFFLLFLVTVLINIWCKRFRKHRKVLHSHSECPEFLWIFWCWFFLNLLYAYKHNTVFILQRWDCSLCAPL